VSQKPLDLPMEVVKGFVEDMRAYHAASNATRRDEIAERQLYALRPFNPPWAKKLQLSDVIQLFQETKDQA
jgi:hypothetical protein